MGPDFTFIKKKKILLPLNMHALPCSLDGVWFREKPLQAPPVILNLSFPAQSIHILLGKSPQHRSCWEVNVIGSPTGH